ncbi:MAG: nucleotidyltransferase domain-containing protein [Rhodospirillaceae bacterium]
MPQLNSSALDLPERYLKMVRELLHRLVPDAEVRAFGSRVTGTADEVSDLDLVIVNPAGPAEETAGLARLKSAFIDSNLPIRVDILDWARIPDSFRAEIERAYVKLQEGRTRWC